MITILYDPIHDPDIKKKTFQELFSILMDRVEFIKKKPSGWPEETLWQICVVISVILMLNNSQEFIFNVI